MRFGIMAMQINALIPSHLSPPQVMAYLGSFDHAELVRGLATSGFKLIELGGDLSIFLPQSYSPTAIERLKSIKHELGLSYTVHLPLWSVETSTPLTPVRQGSVQAVVDIIHATLPLEPESYVLHATGALAAEFYRMNIPELARSLILRQFQSGARQSIQAVLSQTGIPSRLLAIETIEFPFDLTLELAEEFDLSMCLDTGHILAGFSGPIGLFEALERCLPRLGEIHLHDAPWQGPQLQLGYGKDHQTIGKGDLDVAALLDRLVEAQFGGPIIFELKVEEALVSLEAVRALRPALLNPEYPLQQK